MKFSKSNLEKLRQKYNFKLIILHGSQVSGKVHPNSDIDIAVVRNSEQKFDLLELIADLSFELKSDKIDVSDATHADPLFGYAIARNSELLAGERSDFEEFQRIAFHKYCDFLPYLQQESDFVRNNLKKYDGN